MKIVLTSWTPWKGLGYSQELTDHTLSTADLGEEQMKNAACTF